MHIPPPINTEQRKKNFASGFFSKKNIVSSKEIDLQSSNFAEREKTKEGKNETFGLSNTAVTFIPLFPPPCFGEKPSHTNNDSSKKQKYNHRMSNRGIWTGGREIRTSIPSQRRTTAKAQRITEKRSMQKRESSEITPLCNPSTIEKS